MRIGLPAIAGIIVALAATVPIIVILNARHIYSFLAYERRVPADILVVEAWIADYQLQCARNEFVNGRYKLLVLVGGRGEASAARLRGFGVDGDRIHVLPLNRGSRGRTVSSAYSLCEWIRAQPEQVTSVMILTSAPHARKTFTAFSRELQKIGALQVGIVGCENHRCNPKTWWQTPAGVYFAARGAIGFLKVRYF